MMNREDLVTNLLTERISKSKVGIIIKGVDGIQPDIIVKKLAVSTSQKIYAVVIGYDSVSPEDTDEYTIATHIENAVAWRNTPECAGCILVFVQGDVDKLHSLNVFDQINKKDITRFAIDLQTRNVAEENRPIREFWDALKETSEYYSLQNVEEFIDVVENASDKSAAISKNLWRLNMLCDEKILNAKTNRKQRLIDNNSKIIDISQLTENSRKNLSRSLSRASISKKAKLQKAYKYVEEYSQYGSRELLKELDYSIVEQLLSATVKKADSTPVVPPVTPPVTPAPGGEEIPVDPPVKQKTLRQSDVDDIVSDQILFGDDAGHQDIKDLYDELREEYADETKRKISISSAGGIFKDHPIELDKPQDDLRKLVGVLCNENAWGGKLEVKEKTLRDAISSSATPELFTPSSILYPYNHCSFYDFLKEFDSSFKFEKSFQELFDTIIEARKKLCEHIDFLMYNPYVLLDANPEAREALSCYVETWAELYELFNKHKDEMKQKENGPTVFIGRALIALDVLYIHTGDGKWKGMLLPLHPLYLWRYNEISKTLLVNKESLGKSERVDLKSVLLDPPQMLNYLAVDKGLTKDNDIILPCSGSLQMLPTYENSTNRYLGDDGLDSIPDILDRWLNFAPFTRNEMRICTVDAPNLTYVIRKVGAFITKNSVERIILNVFYTRGQNGNTELANLDYADKDYNISEYIKSGRLVLSIRSVKTVEKVQEELAKKPVHVAFYFDQSKYEVREEPNTGRLYSNPFVITYDFSYSSLLHTGSISPSARSQTGIVGDYHNLMVATSYINDNTSPWLSIDPSDSSEGILTTVKNGQTQWLVIADRNIGSYEIKDDYDLIPVGEEIFDRRRVGIWASRDSRIIEQYRNDLMYYPLTPDNAKLVDIIKKFGHIAASGQISIPKIGFDANATKYRQKGLLGTLFAATWYTTKGTDSSASVMVASLDSEKARTWLTARDEEEADIDKKFGQVRADLVGLRYDEDDDTLYVQAIEVKTRDEDNVSQRDYELYTDENGQNRLRGHAPKQIAKTIKILNSIFDDATVSSDSFAAARREVLKYQIITECFRNIHDKQWQEKWHKVLSRAFEKNDRDGLRIAVSGVLVYIRLSEQSVSDSKPIKCLYDDIGESGDYDIELSVLTSHDIQKKVFGEPDVADSSEIMEPEVVVPEPVDSPQNDEIDPDISIPEETPNAQIEGANVENQIIEDQSNKPESNESVISANDTTPVVQKPLSDIRLLLGEEPRTKEQFFWEFGHKKLNNRHLLINGNSGCGKTYCIEALLMEAALQGVSSAVFDFTGGFTSKKLDPIFKEKLGDRIRQRVVRVERIPINPFHRHEIEIDEDIFIPENDVDIASKIAGTVASVYSMGDQQKNAVYTAALTGLQKYGDDMSFKHLAEEMETIDSSYAKTALSRLQQFIDIDPFAVGESFNWSDVRDSNGMVYIFQFVGYGRDIQVMLTELLLWDLWSFSVKNGSEDKPFIYVIDEAQNLSHKEKSPSGMILTEGRKYGLSGWYATQFMKPQLDDDEIQRLQQADQKLYFCPPGEGVMTVAKNIDITTQGAKEWAERLQKLSKGECVTCGSMVRGGKWNKYNPRIIKVTSLDKRID